MSDDSAPRAPSEDFGVYANPPMTEWGEIARSNRRSIERQPLSIGGLETAELRRKARVDFLACAAAFGCGDDPAAAARHAESLWFMTGHQPELYHPGVWAKNFAVASIARAQNGFGGNLVADTDVIKSSSVRVISGTLDSPRVLPVPFDAIDDGRPFEAWKVRDDVLFRSFAASIRAADVALPPDPLLDSFWPHACSVNSESGVKRLTAARREIEKAWGFGLVESPMGVWSETESVSRLFLAILKDLPRFHGIHQEKLSAYRRERRIHSRNHPVADLAREGDWWEAPFWVWRDAAPLRRKFWVRFREAGAKLDCRIEGEASDLGTLAIDRGLIDGAVVSQWRDFSRRGVRIRPRALVTTALCRILLTDLFVHGIGGAIYDVLGDAVFGDFFEMRMPRYAVLTATLRLKDYSPSMAGEERETRIRLSRWLRWQAERIRPDHPDLQELFERKRLWLSHPQADRSDRRLRAVQLRRVNREIARKLEGLIVETDSQIDQLSHRTVSESIVRSREYSILVHSEARLKRLAEKIRALAESDVTEPAKSR